MIPHKLNPMGMDKNYPLMTFEKDGNLFDSDKLYDIFANKIIANGSNPTTWLSYETKDGKRCLLNRQLGISHLAVFYDDFKPNTQYFFTLSAYQESTAGGGLMLQIDYTDGSKGYVHRTVGVGWQTYTVITTAGKTVDKIMQSYHSVVHCWIDLDSMMLIESNVVVDYQPYNPNTYCVYGQSTQETRSLSKNLLDPNKLLTGYSSYGGTTTNTTVVQNFLPNAKSYLLKVNAGNQYAISKQYVTNRFRYFFFVNNPIENPTEMSIGGAYPDIDTVASFTIPTGGNWLFVVLTGDYTTYPVGWSQIELGSTATAYQPYVEMAPSPSSQYPSYPTSNYPKGVYKTNIPSLPYIRLYDDLRGIGGYRDKITYNKADGTKLLTKKNLKITLDGSLDELWSQAGTQLTNTFSAFMNFSNMKNTIPAEKDFLCSILKCVAPSTDYYTNDSELCCGNIVENQIFVVRFFKSRGITSLATLKTYLQNNPMELVYKLATPINQYL